MWSRISPPSKIKRPLQYASGRPGTIMSCEMKKSLQPQWFYCTQGGSIFGVKTPARLKEHHGCGVFFTWKLRGSAITGLQGLAWVACKPQTASAAHGNEHCIDTLRQR